jgi:hypothetical protein
MSTGPKDASQSKANLFGLLGGSGSESEQSDAPVEPVASAFSALGIEDSDEEIEQKEEPKPLPKKEVSKARPQKEKKGAKKEMPAKVSGRTDKFWLWRRIFNSFPFERRPARSISCFSGLSP